VNLSDAATKLQTLVSKAAETAKDSKAIFQVLTLTQKNPYILLLSI
jgi:methylthioribose-1-phosphate isomerase